MHVIVERGATKALADLPRKSIALDGYVQGPAIDAENQRYSFDHHGGCVRHVTRATCEQVRDALLLGLNPAGFTVYVNDVDGDTALSVWLLRNPKSAADPYVDRLVRAVGAVDALGPAYPSKYPGSLRRFFGEAMQAEQEARNNRTYGAIDLGALLDACVAGIDTLVKQCRWLEKVPPTPMPVYEVLHRDPSDAFVTVTATCFAFPALYANGIERAVQAEKLPDGTWKYIVGKRSEFVPDFPVTTILAALVKAEREANPRQDARTTWGGGSTIGGSPRNADGSSSRLTPRDVHSIVSAVVQLAAVADDRARAT